MTAPTVVFVSPFAQLAGAERFLELMLENMPAPWCGAWCFFRTGRSSLGRAKRATP